MCGRFVVKDSTAALLPDLVSAAFGGLRPNYNVAPTNPVTVVRERDGERSAPMVHWGFVPVWAKDFKKQRPQPINARIETVASSPMFRKAFATSRVLIPAAGYYEWTVTETGKQPHFIYEPDAALAMAGIVSAWPDPSKAEDDPEKWRLSTAIITRDSHVAPGEVHDRMPACITPDGYDDWLGGRLDVDALMQLLDRESYAVAHELEHYEVSRDVNSVRNNGPHLLDPLPPAAITK
ncbi:SOS response-associated peptidase [Rathayibacter sp. AY1C5]|uniref:SOS response-associated peptidase n=1 Tax=Rathayibacter sp. AY1C5 TaxID=2080538 RepID=UPI000CE81841|nr:SOS response-associated peptidase [Rathayibacter sp. AY1C5]PPG56516.1 SOS response-associated peptidase [Rathayibacter sp. AY1C5]